MGIAQQVGPDEDDFHSFKRQNAEIEKSEKRVLKRLKQEHAENVPGKPRPTKVVYF
jgi:hypothetical protein